MTDLAQVGQALAQAGHAVAQGPTPDQILVQLSTDDPSEKRLALLRLKDLDPMPGAPALRAFTVLTSYPFAARPSDVNDVRAAAAICTNELAVGHFEVDDDGDVHLAYEALVGPTDAGLLETCVPLLQLIDYQQLHFGDYLEQICSGEINLELFARFVAAGEASGLD